MTTRIAVLKAVPFDDVEVIVALGPEFDEVGVSWRLVCTEPVGSAWGKLI
jgi:hypothetical protein